ncbi:MAG: hypothetical protein RJA22_3025 [Verrucomicrobiota bacterium]
MKKLFVIPALLALLTAGCTHVHRNGTSHVDEFDAIQVDQMTGNEIDSAILSKSILCLNARRETRRVTVTTNTAVLSQTNTTVTPVTNLTVSVATNYQYTVMTNLTPLAGPLPGGAPAPAAGDPTANPAVGTPPPAVEISTNAMAATPAQQATNLTLTLANNASTIIAPTQTSASQQSVRSYNNQLTTTSNNLTVSLLTNRVVTGETNLVVTWLTNTSIVTITNVVLTPTNYTVSDYFLVSELVPPPDFTLAGGESLILLVDGVRHGFTSGQSGTAFVSRRGFSSTLYRVPPTLLVDIANAKEVRVRFKGANNTLERTMSNASKRSFREFLLKYLGAEAPATAQAAR